MRTPCKLKVDALSSANRKIPFDTDGNIIIYMGRGRRSGTPTEINDEWRAAVERGLEEKNMSRTDLARHLHVSRAIVSRLLIKERESDPNAAASRPLQASTLVPAISDYFGIELPGHVDASTRDITETMKSLKRLSPVLHEEMRRLLHETLEMEKRHASGVIKSVRKNRPSPKK